MNANTGVPSAHRKALVIQHDASENLGTIEDALNAAGVAFEYVRTFEGQPVPIEACGASALIMMGGPMGVHEADRFPFLLREMKLIEAFLKAGKPILGVCLGSQLLAAALGMPCRKGPKKEIGWFPVQLSLASTQDALWHGQPSRFVAFHWHTDIFDVPKGAVALASSDVTPVQSYRFGDRAYGILFHIEVAELNIRKMLAQFDAEVRQENLNPAAILKEAESFLPPLRQIGATVFRRWLELV
jgi:GMP synthase (glutamine-hydrolysing)